MSKRPTILIVDDEPFNVDYLEQELEDLDYDTISAANGQQALDQVAAHEPDMILLDIMMPVMDGFQVLTRLKADPRWRDIPVVVISAMSDLESVVRGIKLGADDYLPKPFNETLLRARLSAGLEKKRLRDQEVEYLRQVALLTDAAQAVEQESFDLDSLATVADRTDALGNLARVFRRMAEQVYAREQRLKQQVQELRIELDETRQARQVAEITESDYFRDQRSQASDLRSIVDGA
jgi:CheY-like chemotaxis protein